MKTTFHKRKYTITLSLALLFTTLQITGCQISMLYNTTVHRSDFFQNIGILSPRQIIFSAVVMLPVWWLFLGIMFTLLDKIRPARMRSSKKQSVILWGGSSILLFLCWIPCFLAAYPGFYNYDAMDQVPQVLYAEVPYSTHHPLLHTLFMGKIIAFGYHHGVDLNDGIALHSIIQMIICALSFSYMIYYIYKTSQRHWLYIGAFCYYAFFPPVAMFAMCTTKDVIFSILLQLCIIFLYEMCRDMQRFYSSKFKIARFVTVLVLMCLFRKNGIYVLIGILPVLMILMKKYQKHCLVLISTVAVIYFIVNQGLLFTLNATKGSPKEALSIPMQQLARVYCEHGEYAFTPDELKLIYEGISSEQLLQYNPFLSDHIKNHWNFQTMEENPLRFLSLWINKAIQYPGEYIKAFLDNTYQAWYPGTSIIDEPYAGQTYYFAMSMCAGGERETKLPSLLSFYHKIATDFYYQKIPVVRLFFSIGAMFWVTLFTLSYAFYRKNRPLIAAMLMVMIYCGTVFLGPVSLVRYYLVLFYGFPISIGFLFSASEANPDYFPASDTFVK